MYSFNNTSTHEQDAPKFESNSNSWNPSTPVPNTHEQSNNWQYIIPSAPYEDSVKNEGVPQFLLPHSPESVYRCAERPSSFPSNLNVENFFGNQYNNNNNMLPHTDNSRFAPNPYNNCFSPAVSAGNIPSYNQPISCYYNAQNSPYLQQYLNDGINRSQSMMSENPEFNQYQGNMQMNQFPAQTFGQSMTQENPCFFNYGAQSLDAIKNKAMSFYSEHYMKKDDTDSKGTVGVEQVINQENEPQSKNEDDVSVVTIEKSHDNVDVLSEKTDTEGIDLSEIKSQLCRMEDEIKHLNEMLNDQFDHECIKENCDENVQNDSTASDENDTLEPDDNERTEDEEEEENSDSSEGDSC